MKGFTLFLGFLLSGLCVFSQHDTTYNSTFYYVGGPSNTLNDAENIFRIDKRIYLVLTNVDSQGAYHTIVEIDESGNELKKVSLHHTGGDFVMYPGNSVLVDAANNIIVVSSVLLQYPDPTDGYIAKLTPELDTLWTRTYTLPPTLAGCPADTFVGNNFTAIQQTLDGDYIIAGNYRLNCQPGAISDRPFLLKVDTAGVVQWWSVFPNHHRIFDLEVSRDSGFVFLDLKNTGLDLIKLNKNGDFQWLSTLDNIYTHVTAQDVELVFDSIAAIAASHLYDYSSSRPILGIDFFLFNMNSQSLISAHYYEPYMNVETALLHQNMKFQRVVDGYIIAATAMVLGPDSIEAGLKGIILKLDPLGDSIWIRYYAYGDFEDICQFNDVLLMDDGGFLAVGFHFPWTSNYGAWLVKTDSNGYAPGSYPTGIEKPTSLVSNISLYPNPANDITYIGGLPIEYDWQDIELSVFDVGGRLQKTMVTRSSGGVVQVDLTELRMGIYFIHLALPGGETVVRKVVKL